MNDLVARCRSCGYEHADDFARCPVCLGDAGWWCVACHDWRPARACPACGGHLAVPAEVRLGQFPAGIRVPVRFLIRNPGKKPLEFAVQTPDPALLLLTRRLVLKPSEEAAVLGAIEPGVAVPGPRTYTVRFQSPIPAETKLLVEVVAAVARLEFTPGELVVRSAAPGKTYRRNLTVKNTGNVPVHAGVTGTEAWLTATPARVELAPGGSTVLRVIAKTRKTECGVRAARLRLAADGGKSWDAAVSVHLPEPRVEAAPVEFGDVRSGRAAFGSVTLRNTGKVRAVCTLAADQPWLAVTPKRINLPPGREKVAKVRVRFAEEDAGPQQAGILVTFDGRQLLRVPVSACCVIPEARLGSIRRQTLGAVANDVPVVRRFALSNAGDGRLNCRVTADASWIEILTPTLRVGPGKKRRVEFRIDTPGMPVGLKIATIQVESNGGNASVPLTFTVVAPAPELELLGDADLGTVSGHAPVSGHFLVRNGGVGLLTLRAEPEDSRVKVIPAETTLQPGPPTKLALSVAVDGLPGGSHALGVRFGGNGGEARSEVRFRLPVESVDLPSLLDLGDRPAGRPVGEVLRIRNTGPDPVSLRIQSDDARVRRDAEEVLVAPGEMVAVPFSLAVPVEAGPVAAALHIEGRMLRHTVAVRAVARKVELAAIPQTVLLGSMSPGEERYVTFLLANRGECAAEVRESRGVGELAVSIRRQTVPPGTTLPVTARVKMNARVVGRQVRATVPVADDLSVRFSANVGRPRRPRILAAVTGGVGVLTGAALGAAVGWGLGGFVAVIGLVAAGIVYLVMND